MVRDQRYSGYGTANPSAEIMSRIISMEVNRLRRDLLAVSGAALVGYIAGIDGAVAATVADKLSNAINIKEFGSVSGDASAAFLAAAASGRVVQIRESDGPFNISGTFPITSGTVLLFEDNPVINMTVDGDERGFHFDHGTTDAAIMGAATINITTTTPGTDGSFNGAISFGRFYYTSDPSAIRRCKVVGQIQINCVGVANSKPVHLYGWVEDCIVDGVHATGQTNYTFSAHWSGNGTAVTLPTKTWHPHNIYFKRCKSYASAGSTLRSFTASACGKVVYEDCESKDVTTIGFNIFAGDYGYTYAQNIARQDACRIFLNRGKTSGTCTGLTFDAQTIGLNGSPIWTGSEHNAGLFVDGLLVDIGSAATSTVGFAVSHAKFLDAKVRIIESGTTNETQSLTLFGVGTAIMRGKMLCRFGAIVRACGHVDVDMPIVSKLPEADSARYAISASATSGGGTTSGAVAVGGTSVTIVGNAVVTGAGGYLRYNDGATDHEIEMLTSTYSSGNQNVTIVPSPVLIPDGSTVTVIQTVKSMAVGSSKLSGFASGVRCTGSATAKVRNVHLKGTVFDRCGIYDADFTAVDGVRAIGTVHDYGGQRTTTTDRRGIVFGANAENFLVSGARFGKKNNRLRYLVYVDNAAVNGVINNNLFESFNASATNPAAVFKSTAVNVTIGANNVYGAGVTTLYP